MTINKLGYDIEIRKILLSNTLCKRDLRLFDMYDICDAFSLGIFNKRLNAQWNNYNVWDINKYAINIYFLLRPTKHTFAQLLPLLQIYWNISAEMHSLSLCALFISQSLKYAQRKMRERIKQFSRTAVSFICKVAEFREMM